MWREHRAWGGVKDLVPSCRPRITSGRCMGASSATITASKACTVWVWTTSRLRSDYPHTDTTWPNTLEVATQMMGHLPADVQYKILRGNAIRMLGLDIV